MKLVLNVKEITQIVVDHLTENGQLSDNDTPILTTWHTDGRNTTLTLEEHNE